MLRHRILPDGAEADDVGVGSMGVAYSADGVYAVVELMFTVALVLGTLVL